MSKRILLIGPYPDPIGGVSIHLQRLVSLLKNNKFQVTVVDESPRKKHGIFNIRSLNIVKYLHCFLKSDVIHIHSSVTIFRVLHMLLSSLFSVPFIVTLHSWRQSPGIMYNLQRRLFNNAQQLICVNSKIADELNLSNSVVMPAFLPPELDHELSLPPNITKWLKSKRSEGKVVITSNAYRLDTFNDEDLYGLDMAIELIEYLKVEVSTQVAMVFVVASLNKNDQMYSKYLSAIEKKGLNTDFYLVHESNLSFVKLIEQSDFTCRLTNTDGDALSVRESLYLRVPVVASDAADRPSGTILFKTRNQKSLNKTFKETITEPPALSSDYSDCKSLNEFYRSLYIVEKES